MKKTLLAALSAALLSGVASAQFVIDGAAGGQYPASNRFQTTDTGFGDSNTGNIFNANGSELDGVFAAFEPGFLNIIFTGNLETNFNVFNIYFDAPGIATGQNVLNTTGSIGPLNGLTFDSGFAPDFYLQVNAGNGAMYVNYATLVSGTAASIDSPDGYLGTNDGQSGGVLSGGSNPGGLLAALNNLNTAGVGGTGGFTGDPTTVATGIEFHIPTSIIGNVSYGTGGVQVAAMINGGGNSFLSNQVLGGLPSGSSNLGNPSNVNFNNVAGNQYFMVPEPATMAALGLGLFGIAARRRRSK